LPDLKLADKCRKIAYNVNAFKKVGDKNVRKLLEFISTGKSETSLTNKISNELRRVQGNEEWRAEYMTLEMLKKDTYDSGFTAGEKVGEERGRNEAKLETAKTLLAFGDSIEKVSKVTGLSVEEIEKL
jgi:predicted transposase/invertase (TIGR01784 family)